MKKYIFELAGEENSIVIIAKNLQSAMARLTEGNFYSEDQVIIITIIR